MQQFARFAVVGLTTNLILYGAYLALTYSTYSPKTAMTMVYVAGVLLGFLGNRYWAFRSASHSNFSIIRYFAAYAFGYIVNLAGLHLGASVLNIPHEWVQGFMVIIVAVIMFILQKYFVFAIGQPIGESSRRP